MNTLLNNNLPVLANEGDLLFYIQIKNFQC